MLKASFTRAYLDGQVLGPVDHIAHSLVVQVVILSSLYPKAQVEAPPSIKNPSKYNKNKTQLNPKKVFKYINY